MDKAFFQLNNHQHFLHNGELHKVCHKGKGLALQLDTEGNPQVKIPGMTRVTVLTDEEVAERLSVDNSQNEVIVEVKEEAPASDPFGHTSWGLSGDGESNESALDENG